MVKIGDIIAPLRRSPSSCSPLSRLEKLLVATLTLITSLCVTLLISVISLSYQNEKNTCKGATNQTNQLNSSVCVSKECIEFAAKILQQIDESVSPCEDFYSFACGGVEKAFTVIPEDRSNLWSASLLQLNIDQKLKAFIENISAKEEDNYLNKIKVSYNQCMDQESIEALGNTPLEMIFEQIGGWPVLQPDNWTDPMKNLTERLIKMKEIGLRFDVFSEIQVLPHVIDEHFNAIYMGNPLLVLDDRGYYEKGINDTVLRSYYDFMIDASILLGAPSESAKTEMLQVLQFEISLTKIMASKDPKGNVYNPRNFTELKEMAPAIDWKHFFNEITYPFLRLPNDYYVILEYPDYISNLSVLIENTDNRVLANFIGWRAVIEMTALLDKNWGILARKLYRHLDGRLRLLPRWKFCINLAKKYFNIGVSSLYVQQTPEVRKQIKVVKKMVNEIRAAFLDLVKSNTWMDNETMNAAVNKTKVMHSFVGFPHQLLNETLVDEYYSMLDVNVNTSFFVNVLRMRRWRVDTNFLKLNSRNRKLNWKTYANVIDVNAYYRIQENSIQFPLTIIEALSISESKPMYLNYGSIGWVIGHEITHGFDDSGRLFDEYGEYNEWWTNNTKKEFDRKAECFVQQYSNYSSPMTGMKLNGMLTLGENIADNGGIKQAYRAYEKYASKDPLLPGLKYSPLQLFFIQSASFYCGKWRKQMLEYIIRTDNHSTNRFRIIGTMSNFKQFSSAFHCNKQNAMNPEKKCELW